MPFIPFAPVIGNIVPPLPVAQGGTGAITPAAALTDLGGLVLQAATPAAGYTLINGTGNIITWTAPNDGAVHRFLVVTILDVTSAQTGGQISATSTMPNAAASSQILYPGGQAGGAHTPGSGNFPQQVQAGTTVTISQSSALTLGAAVLWAEIWAL